ncbi:MAG: DUF1761 domain-containing protein [Mesorhizobium sp.]|nr:DUF1761 domain-containing protein [Mesorhizobium sp.]
MDFSVINWLAVVLAAVLAWLFGAAWYMSLGKPWMAAAKIDPTKMQRSAVPFIISFIAELLMATIVALLLGAVTGGEPSLVAGLIFGFVFWLGFVATTLTVNNRYEGFGWTLTLIDGAHWLGVLLIIGAVIGWFGGPAIE